MDDAQRVSLGKAVADLDQQFQLLLQAGCVLAHPLLQGGAFHIFHHQRDAVAVFDHIVELDNIGVVELCQQLGFRLDALGGGGAGGVFAQFLDCHRALQLGVPRQIDHAHTASTKRVLDAVTTQLLLFRFGDFHGRFSSCWLCVR